MGKPASAGTQKYFYTHEAKGSSRPSSRQLFQGRGVPAEDVHSPRMHGPRCASVMMRWIASTVVVWRALAVDEGNASSSKTQELRASGVREGRTTRPGSSQVLHLQHSIEYCPSRPRIRSLVRAGGTCSSALRGWARGKVTGRRILSNAC